LKTKISTRNLELIPDIDLLKKQLQSLAVLDLIIPPDEWEDRYYSFDSNWSAAEQMGSMRNSSGDEFFALFNSAGCFIKGFAHESKMTPARVNPPALWPRILEGIPDEFIDARNEPAFGMESVTFCIWRRYCDLSWSIGPIDFPQGDDVDGSEDLLAILDGQVNTYCQFVEEYFETVIPVLAVQHVYDHLPLTERIVELLNPEASLSTLTDDLAEIGYKS
jgi:hypothetical protein